MRVAIAILALALAGCDSGTEPEPDPFTLSITAPSTVSGQAATRNNTTVHLCSAEVTARASGGDDREDYAVWDSGEMTWTDLATGSTTARWTMSEVDLVDFWGSARIDSGESQRAEWEWWGTGPFRVQITMRYEVGWSGEFQDQLTSQTIFITCQ